MEDKHLAAMITSDELKREEELKKREVMQFQWMLCNMTSLPVFRLYAVISFCLFSMLLFRNRIWKQLLCYRMKWVLSCTMWLCQLYNVTCKVTSGHCDICTKWQVDTVTFVQSDKWTLWHLYSDKWTLWHLYEVTSGHCDICTKWQVDTVTFVQWQVDTVTFVWSDKWTLWHLYKVTSGHCDIGIIWEKCAVRPLYNVASVWLYYYCILKHNLFTMWFM